MPPKTPIYLKPANNKKGRKFKLRDILSPDMISPPLGDFRHTIHIGKEGQHDVFGDISFLQGHYELLPWNLERMWIGQLAGQSEFLRTNSTSGSMFSDTRCSPVLKNAISLPAIGDSQALMLPLWSPVTFNTKQDSFGPSMLCCEPIIEENTQEKTSHLENGTGHPEYSLWKGNNGTASGYSNGRDSHSSSLSEQYSDWQTEDMFDSSVPCELKEKPNLEESLSELTDSLLSLKLDLGPSLLDEVLNVMDKNKV